MALSLSSVLRIKNSSGEYITIEINNWCQELLFKNDELKKDTLVEINNKSLVKAINKFFPKEDHVEVMQIILSNANDEMKYKLMLN